MFNYLSQPLDPVYLFSIPRGASNIFSALLHNHDSIVVGTHTSMKDYILQVNNSSSIHLSDYDFVYAESPPKKDPQKLRYLVFHNIHYSKKLGFYFLNHAVQNIQAGSAKGIVLFRHPISVLLSMDSFGTKYNRPGWKLTHRNAYHTMKYFITPILQLLKNPALYPVEAGAFIKNIDSQYSDLCDFLGLNYISRYSSFEKSFSYLKTLEGSDYKIGEFSAYQGNFLESQNYKPKPERMYYNPITGKPLLGRGGFNPCAPLSHQRLAAFKHRLTPESERILKRVFQGFMSREDAQWLMDNEELDVERLKNIDIKKFSSHRLGLESLVLIERAQKKFMPSRSSS